MPKRKNPDTSLEAGRKAKAFLTAHQMKIIKALRLVRKGMMYEQIAAHTSLEKHQIGRRTLELIKKGLIYVTDEKRKTISGCNAQVYDLTQAGWEYEIPEADLPGKTIVDYSKAIQSVTPLTLF